MGIGGEVDFVFSDVLDSDEANFDDAANHVFSLEDSLRYTFFLSLLVFCFDGESELDASEIVSSLSRAIESDLFALGYGKYISDAYQSDARIVWAT